MKYYCFYSRNRPKERDVSEQIALGVQSASNAGVQYDQRLFNTTAVRIYFWSFFNNETLFFMSRVLVVVWVMMKLIMYTINLGIHLRLLLLKFINQQKQQKIIMMIQKL